MVDSENFSFNHKRSTSETLALSCDVPVSRLLLYISIKHPLNKFRDRVKSSVLSDLF